MKNHYFLLVLLITMISSGLFANNTSLIASELSEESVMSIFETVIESEEVSKKEIDDFTIYPNPVKDGSFRLISLNKATKRIQIYDMLGKQVLSQVVRYNEVISVNHLHAGIYILKVEEGGKYATRKLVIE